MHLSLADDGRGAATRAIACARTERQRRRRRCVADGSDSTETAEKVVAVRTASRSRPRLMRRWPVVVGSGGVVCDANRRLAALLGLGVGLPGCLLEGLGS